jgi:hypothetical protein
MTEDAPEVRTALDRAARLVRESVGDRVSLALYEAVGRAVSEAHMAAHAAAVDGLLSGLKADTDAVEDALLALWHDDGDGPRVLTAELAEGMVARLNGEDVDLPEPSLAAYDAAEAARPDDGLGAAVERFVRYKTAEAAWDAVEGDRRAARAVLACLPEDVADDLRDRLAARHAGEPALPE